jgi:REP-associated tyrosine transposase
MDKFHNKYRIASTRLQNWDYSWNGSYFLTICTHRREWFFGKIANKFMVLSEIGLLAEKFWFEIPNHFPHVFLDAFVVMPNHVHGIIIIESPYYKKPPDTSSKTIGQMRFRNQGKNTISSMMGSYKSSVSKFAHKIDPAFGWQERFHDHIISSKDEFLRIRRYIINNPENWGHDRFHRK